MVYIYIYIHTHHVCLYLTSKSHWDWNLFCKWDPAKYVYIYIFTNSGGRWCSAALVVSNPASWMEKSFTNGDSKRRIRGWHESTLKDQLCLWLCSSHECLWHTKHTVYIILHVLHLHLLWSDCNWAVTIHCSNYLLICWLFYWSSN